MIPVEKPNATKKFTAVLAVQHEGLEFGISSSAELGRELRY